MTSSSRAALAAPVALFLFASFAGCGSRSSSGGSGTASVAAGGTGSPTSQASPAPTSTPSPSSGSATAPTGSATVSQPWYTGNTPLTQATTVLAVDPTSPSGVWAGGPAGLQFSGDGGNDWTPELVTGGSFAVNAIAVDPTPNSTTLYVAITVGSSGAIVKSSDFGGTWTPYVAPATPGWVNAIALDPTNPSTVYGSILIPLAGTDLDSLLEISHDGGSTWQIVVPRLTGSVFAALVVDPTSSQNVYAVTVPGTVANPVASGVAKSTDGGQTWASVGGSFFASASFYMTQGTPLAIDPTAPGTLYVAGIQSGGLPFLGKTTDGGTTWSSVAPTTAPGFLDTVLVDPLAPATIYACGSQTTATGGFTASLFRSQDGGATWRDGSANLPAGATQTVLALAPSQSGALDAAFPNLTPNNTFVYSFTGGF